EKAGVGALDLGLEFAAEHRAVYIFSTFRGGYDTRPRPKSLRPDSGESPDAHLYPALRVAPAGRAGLGRRHVLRLDDPAPGGRRRAAAAGAPAPVARRVLALLRLGMGGRAGATDQRPGH